jgi:hypothetical protein
MYILWSCPLASGRESCIPVSRYSTVGVEHILESEVVVTVILSVVSMVVKGVHLGAFLLEM